MKYSRIIMMLLLAMTMLVTGCGDSETKDDNVQKPEMIFYIGITMVKPVSELADRFMKENNCVIKIIQGGSKDLYASALSSQTGDLYLPGSVSYRYNNINDGILLSGKFVGYNKAAIMVKKGNPENIQSDLNIFTDKKLKVVLCNPESGSIGKETKSILEAFGSYDQALDNAAFFAADSRNLTKAIKNNTADVCINWYATGKWDVNRDDVEVLPIDEKYAKKKKLVFSLLKSSKHPELATKFMEYAASAEGRQVFYDFGFLDDKDLAEFDKITF